MKLFWFETYKIFSRWRTYISFGFIALIVIMTEVVMKLSAHEILYRMMRSFQKDFLIFGNVLNGWFITAFIMNSLHIHIPFFITLVAGDIVSSEATSGTVRLLLIRPPSRSKIITAKYLTTLFYTTGLVIFLGLICITLGLLLFGNGDLIMNYQTQFRLVFIPEAEVPSANASCLHSGGLVHDGRGFSRLSFFDAGGELHRPDHWHNGCRHCLSRCRELSL